MKFFPIISLIGISLIPLFTFLHPGFPITHDGQDHVARIANFYTNLEQGNLIPRWAPNLNWGYGHPILMFLYPLPSYIASLFHFFGFSFIDSTKLVFSFSYIASGVTMYLWVKEFLGKYAGFTAALLYLFAPYRFVDMYVRAAIGEHIAFVFLPLILYFFLKLSKKYSYLYLVGGIVAIACLLLSHNAISLMFFPILFFYIVILLLQHKCKKKFFLASCVIVILGFSLAAFFWLPAFIEGKYTLRDIVTAGEYKNRFVQLKDLFFSQWGFGGSGLFSVQVGIIHWIAVGLSIISLLFFRKKVKNSFLFIGFLFFFFFSIIIMLQNSSFIWENITTLQKFQFPWRFLTISVFTASLLGGWMVSIINKKYYLTVSIGLCIGLMFLNYPFWKANGYFSKPDTFFSGVYDGTTDTGESAPIWSVRFMEKRPKAAIEVIDGKASIHEVKREVILHTYLAKADQLVRIRENTLYFPGWNVLIDNRKLPENEIEYQDPANRGLMTFFVPGGTHRVMVQFTETKLRLFADLISIVAFGVMVSLVIFLRKKLWQRYLSY